MSPLFDPRQGEANKQDGLYIVSVHASLFWTDTAIEAVHRAALSCPTFTADDIWARIPPDIRTRNNKAMGPILRYAVKQGWCAKAEHIPWVLCKRASRNRAPMQVWQSLIYDPDYHDRGFLCPR